MSASNPPAAPTSGSNENRPLGYSFSSQAFVTTIISLAFVGIIFLALYAYVRYLLGEQYLHLAAAREADDRGLDPDTIAALPSFVYRGQLSSREDECAVCLGAMEAGQSARLLPQCKHVFHVECVDEWLRRHSTCPLCRGSVRPAAASDKVEAGVEAPPLVVIVEEGSTSRAESSSFRMERTREWCGREGRRVGPLEHLERV